MTKKRLYTLELDKISFNKLSKFLPRYNVKPLACAKAGGSKKKKGLKKKLQLFKTRLRQICKCFFLKPHAFILWGPKKPSRFIERISNRLNIPIIYFEPVFSPSSLKKHHPEQAYKLTKAHDLNLPLAGILDLAHRYFNTPYINRTVNTLNNHSFDTQTIERGKNAIDLLIKNRILSELIPPEKTIHTYENCVLILGQSPQELQLNDGNGFSFNNLVRTAAKEHQNKTIVYLPTDDVMAAPDSDLNHPIHVSHLCTIKTNRESLYSYLNKTTTVYTHSDFMGFDFLIRGANIITFGVPFYAGWGLTDDRDLQKPRKRTLTLPELVAGVYCLATHYFDPASDKMVPFEDAIEKIIEMKPHIIATELIHLGNQAEKKKSFSKAEAYYKHALSLKPESGQTLWKLGTTLNNQAKYSEAIEFFEKAVEIDPSVAAWNFDLARGWKRTGKYNSKIKECYTAAVKQTNYSNFRYLSTLINYKWITEGISRNLLDLTTKAFRKRKFIPPSILLKYAAILNEAGFTSDALMRYKQAIKLKPSCIDQRRYLALKAMVTSVEPGIHGASSYERDIFNKYKSQQGRFKQLIQKHKNDFCVIGNSPCELGKNQGEAIDKNSLVIRFNNFATDYPYCKDYGKKTNIWVKTTNFVDVKRRDLSDFEHILLSSANIENTGSQGTSDIFEFIELGKTVEAYPQQIVLEVISKLNTPPSAGILLLYWIYKLTGPIDRKHVYGFSFTDQGRGESSHYFEKSTNHGYRHNWDSEKSFFETLLK